MATKTINLNKVSFIKAVQQFPFLYDRYHEDFKNKPRIESTWVELAMEFDFENAYDAKATWSNILKARNRARTFMANGTGQQKPYIYEPHLTFLDEFIDSEGNSSNFENSSANQSLIGLVLNNINEFSNEDGGSSSNFNISNQQQDYESKRYKTSNSDVRTTNYPNRNKIYHGDSSENMGETFGKTIGIALSRLSPKTQIQAQLDILQALLKYVED